jgi:hypothetical protein
MLFSMLANLAEDRQGIAAEPGRGQSRHAIAKLKAARHRRDAVAALLTQCARRAGADRAPDRSAPQVDARPPQPHRRTDATA